MTSKARNIKYVHGIAPKTATAVVVETPTFADFELFADGSIFAAGVGHQVDKHNLAENFPKVQVRRVVQGSVTALEFTGCCFKTGGFAPALPFATLPVGFRPTSEVTVKVKQQENALAGTDSLLTFKVNGQILNTRGGSFTHFTNTRGKNITFAFSSSA